MKHASFCTIRNITNIHKYHKYILCIEHFSNVLFLSLPPPCPFILFMKNGHLLTWQNYTSLFFLFHAWHICMFSAYLLIYMLNTLNTTSSFHFLKCNNNADRFVRLYACTHMHIIRKCPNTTNTSTMERRLQESM